MDISEAQQEAWDKLEQRWQKLGFEKLTDTERQFIALESLAGDTLNGSLEQYFFNSSGDLVLVAIDALQVLGEEQVSSTLRTVIETLWPRGYPTDRGERLETMTREWEADDFLSQETKIVVESHDRFLKRGLDKLGDLYSEPSA